MSINDGKLLEHELSIYFIVGGIWDRDDQINRPNLKTGEFQNNYE